ncbi:toxin [uncultured Paraglaciecola sp.]|uniref:toxin n=1 Tax=uncultured Paraglaciecola sp. TaxID=1765024 RepID=UPI002606C3E4|nr:toxin [uncultured Paraglaciecola sp.]
MNERGISFEDIVFSVQQQDLLDDLCHPNKDKYPNQRMFVVNVEGYVHLVPYVENEQEIFLKTIIPSRNATKKYLGGEA